MEKIILRTKWNLVLLGLILSIFQSSSQAGVCTTCQMDEPGHHATCSSGHTTCPVCISNYIQSLDLATQTQTLARLRNEGVPCPYFHPPSSGAGQCHHKTAFDQAMKEIPEEPKAAFPIGRRQILERIAAAQASLDHGHQNLEQKAKLLADMIEDVLVLRCPNLSCNKAIATRPDDDGCNGGECTQCGTRFCILCHKHFKDKPGQPPANAQAHDCAREHTQNYWDYRGTPENPMNDAWDWQKYRRGLEKLIASLRAIPQFAELLTPEIFHAAEKRLAAPLKLARFWPLPIGKTTEEYIAAVKMSRLSWAEQNYRIQAEHIFWSNYKIPADPLASDAPEHTEEENAHLLQAECTRREVDAPTSLNVSTMNLAIYGSLQKRDHRLQQPAAPAPGADVQPVSRAVFEARVPRIPFSDPRVPRAFAGQFADGVGVYIPPKLRTAYSGINEGTYDQAVQTCHAAGGELLTEIQYHRFLSTTKIIHPFSDLPAAQGVHFWVSDVRFGYISTAEGGPLFGAPHDRNAFICKTPIIRPEIRTLTAHQILRLPSKFAHLEGSTPRDPVYQINTILLKMGGRAASRQMAEEKCEAAGAHLMSVYERGITITALNGDTYEPRLIQGLIRETPGEAHQTELFWLSGEFLEEEYSTFLPAFVASGLELGFARGWAGIDGAMSFPLNGKKKAGEIYPSTLPESRKFFCIMGSEALR